MGDQTKLFGEDPPRPWQESDALFTSLTDEWRTPDSLFATLDGEFRFTLDACATPENARCDRFFTRAVNGLAQIWAPAVCWMNPPYGREIGDWTRKAKWEAARGAIVVALVPSRTDTAWWHEDIMGNEIRFIRGRLTFGDAIHNAPFPSAVVIFRPEPEL